MRRNRPLHIWEGDKLMEEKLIKAIKKLFAEKWLYFELGSSQGDLVEAYVIKTIKDTIKEMETN